MASIFIELEIPENSKEFFTTTDLNPFEREVYLIRVDTDSKTRLALDIMQEVRYQKQRDAETKKRLAGITS